MNKILPYLYIFIGIVIIIGTISAISQERESYRLLLSFQTESKLVFLLVRALFASWFLFDGIKKLKAQRES
ncbi:conserved protein of unknown function [Tenacibaculum sp. 190524A02b]|uniref:Uncharacterized protein n=1 Tax=Tenacibaculum vairaonense TaxID=3137860 RepID=A0ABM9PPH9_9FLAO